MNNDIKGNYWLIKQTIIYGIAGGIDALASFILIPIYTHKFSPDTYGTLQMFNLFLSISSKICSLGMTNSYLRAYHIFREYPSSSILEVAITLQIIAVGIFVILITIIANLPVDITYFIGSYWTSSLFILLILALISSLVVGIVFSHLRSQENASRFTRMAAIGAASNIFLNLLFIYPFNLGFEGIILSNIISNFILCICILEKPSFSIFSNFAHLRAISGHLLSFGLPLVPAAMGMWVIDLSDRYILNVYHGETTVGIYSLGYKYASIILICITMLHTAWIPALLRTYREAKRGVFIRFFSISALSGLGLVFLIELALYLIRKPVISLISSPEYHGAEQIIGPILMGMFFYAIYYLLTGIAFVEGKNQSVLIGSTVGAIVNIGLNIAWIPKYEALGAAWATCFGYATFALATYCYLRPFGKNSLFAGNQDPVSIVGKTVD